MQTSSPSIGGASTSDQNPIELQRRIIVVTGSSMATNMKASAPGTAKHEVYKTMIENDESVWYPNLTV